MPEITSSIRHVQEINVLLQPNDKHYRTFPELTFIIEKYERSLLARTDNGYMYFTWPNSNEDFIHLLARIDKDYMLTKMSNRSVFQPRETVKRLKQLRPELSRTLDELERIPAAYPFTEQYLSLPGTHSDDIEAFIWDYPEAHKAIADVFIDCVQPMLKNQS